MTGPYLPAVFFTCAALFFFSLLAMAINRFIRGPAQRVLFYTFSLVLFLPASLFLSFMSYVDEAGVVHEPGFGYLPVVMLLPLFGIAGLVVTLVASRRQNGTSSRGNRL